MREPRLVEDQASEDLHCPCRSILAEVFWDPRDILTVAAIQERVQTHGVATVETPMLNGRHATRGPAVRIKDCCVRRTRLWKNFSNIDFSGCSLKVLLTLDANCITTGPFFCGRLKTSCEVSAGQEQKRQEHRLHGKQHIIFFGREEQYLAFDCSPIARLTSARGMRCGWPGICGKNHSCKLQPVKWGASRWVLMILGHSWKNKDFQKYKFDYAKVRSSGNPKTLCETCVQCTCRCPAAGLQL